MHRSTSSSEVFVQQLESEDTKCTSRVTQGQVTYLCSGPVGLGSPRSNFDNIL